jgi:hypothetical protein
MNNKGRIDKDFEHWIAWAENTKAFPNLVAELRTRADETGRKEAVALLQAIHTRRRSKTRRGIIATVLIIVIIAGTVTAIIAAFA